MNTEAKKRGLKEFNVKIKENSYSLENVKN